MTLEEANSLEERLQVAHELSVELNKMETERLFYLGQLKSEMERMEEDLNGINYEQNNINRDIAELERKQAEGRDWVNESK